MVLREVEEPLLREVMTFHEGNQSRAATALGINRATLRKKLSIYGLL
jgi:Fis family transcriptional regulator